MRNEKQVIYEILNFAENNDMVRAVIWNGSRVNSNAPKDKYRDYDVIFAVTDPEYFLRNQAWIEKLGELIIMQQNDFYEENVKSYIFLMLFKDGVRIDLTFFPVEHISLKYKDSLKVLLLDKDNKIPKFDSSNESYYVTRKPSKKQYDETINNFWWCATNVAKGICRKELSYTKYMFDAVVREEIITVVAWYIGANNNWSVNPGKLGKWFEKYLPSELWSLMEKTYSSCDYEETWRSLLAACKLISIVGPKVAENLGYDYPVEDDKNVTKYLKKLQELS
ncbi:aminoglycoside 6-adenylyltransferase [Clostridium hydrogenum]|uniref:aminoglycoside 6-adenylyltransferase n=1 Tax=Clostridium hydrogenum TaxID=2855764 RepID=UPI001F167717|nr:aminoglycoside 6-adenylyltransferase [Clostridium hydrogenum]